MINSRWERPTGLDRLEIVNPANGEPVAIAMLADCLRETGFSPGTIADIPVTGPVAGDALSSHPGLVRHRVCPPGTTDHARNTAFPRHMAPI